MSDPNSSFDSTQSHIEGGINPLAEVVARQIETLHQSQSHVECTPEQFEETLQLLAARSTRRAQVTQESLVDEGRVSAGVKRQRQRGDKFGDGEGDRLAKVRKKGRVDLSGIRKVYGTRLEDDICRADEGYETTSTSCDDDEDEEGEMLGLPSTSVDIFTGQTFDLGNSSINKVFATLGDSKKQHLLDSSPSTIPLGEKNFNLFLSLCTHHVLIENVCKHLPPKDIVSLYSISKAFHEILNSRFRSTIQDLAEYQAPGSVKMFWWKYYKNLLIDDPAGTHWVPKGPFDNVFDGNAYDNGENKENHSPPQARQVEQPYYANQIRQVPSLRWLQMVVSRYRQCRDILACLARADHRCPPTTIDTLRKMWLIMDCSTNEMRAAFMRNDEYWTDVDLYNAQLFYIKLMMRFNHPDCAIVSPALVHVLLGQRTGFLALWQLLREKKPFRGSRDEYGDLIFPALQGQGVDGGEVVEAVETVLQMHVRYEHPGYDLDDLWQWDEEQMANFSLDLMGVPLHEVGVGHLEGWGKGRVHLFRPDELVLMESVRRHLDLERHGVFMAVWGHLNLRTGENLVPSEEEMYMSDDDLPPVSRLKLVDDGLGVLGTPEEQRLLKVRHDIHVGRCGNVPFRPGEWRPKHSRKSRWSSLDDVERKAINADDEDEHLSHLVNDADANEDWNADALEDLYDSAASTIILERPEAVGKQHLAQSSPLAGPPQALRPQGTLYGPHRAASDGVLLQQMRMRFSSLQLEHLGERGGAFASDEEQSDGDEMDIDQDDDVGERPSKPNLSQSSWAKPEAPTGDEGQSSNGIANSEKIRGITMLYNDFR